MNAISNLLLPNVFLIKEEIKVCKGCMQGHMLSSLVMDKEKLGITDWWFSTYKWGKKEQQSYTVKHIDNHPDCFNYEIKIIQKIIFEYLDKNQLHEVHRL